MSGRSLKLVEAMEGVFRKGGVMTEMVFSGRGGTRGAALGSEA